MGRKSNKQIAEEKALYDKGLAFLESEVQQDDHILMVPLLKKQIDRELKNKKKWRT